MLIKAINDDKIKLTLYIGVSFFAVHKQYRPLITLPIAMINQSIYNTIAKTKLLLNKGCHKSTVSLVHCRNIVLKHNFDRMFYICVNFVIKSESFYCSFELIVKILRNSCDFRKKIVDLVQLICYIVPRRSVITLK